MQDATAEAAALRARVEELQQRLDAAAQDIGPAAQAQSATPAWAHWKRVEDFPRDRLLFVSFSNGHYADLMMNWVQTLRVLEVTPTADHAFALARLAAILTTTDQGRRTRQQLCGLESNGTSRRRYVRVVVSSPSNRTTLCAGAAHGCGL